MEWCGDGALLVRKVVQPSARYELLVYRYLEQGSSGSSGGGGGEELKIIAKFNDFSDKSKNVTAISYFKRDGPSPKKKEMEEYVAQAEAEAQIQTEESTSGGAGSGANANAGSDGIEGTEGERGSEEAGAEVNKKGEVGKSESESESDGREEEVDVKAPSSSSSSSLYSPLPLSPPLPPAQSHSHSSRREGRQGLTPAPAPAPAPAPPLLAGPDVFCGRWHRTAQINYGAVLAVLGVEEKERVVAIGSDVTIIANIMHRERDNKTFIRMREQTGGHGSAVGKRLTVDCTYDITPSPYQASTVVRTSTINNLAREREVGVKGGWGGEMMESMQAGGGQHLESELFRNGVIWPLHLLLLLLLILL